MIASTGWQVGLAIGIAVVAVAAVIVITIVLLALKIAKQAKTAEEAVEVVRQQTAELGGIATHQRLGRQDPARRAVPAEGGGREVTLALTSNGYWVVALGLGAAAAVVVAILLAVLLQAVGSIEKSVDGLLEIAGKVAANTSNIPQLEATAPVLAQIVDEAVIQDGYMNALTDGYDAA